METDCANLMMKSYYIFSCMLQIMRNIFQACYNAYKPENEPELSDQTAMKGMKFSPRLFEIKLHHRKENVAYIEDANLFVVTEGEASRCVNFNTGRNCKI